MASPEPSLPALDGCTTEMADPRLRDLDLMDTADMVRVMNEAEAEVPRAVARASAQICAAVDAAAHALGAGGRMFYVGAGTPGRLGILDASECPPTFSTDPSLVQGIIAGGPSAITEAVEGAEDAVEQGAADLRAREPRADDVVVGISASGRTPYVLGAIGCATELGATTIGIASNRDCALSRAVQHPIEVVVGPEVITGSTRLKAGSAQKQVLNMLSTLTMVKLGKTYGNLMVDVAATNNKLLARALRLVMQLGQVDEATARAALEQCDGHVKTAVVVLRRGVDAEEARALLADADGHLRAALGG